MKRKSTCKRNQRGVALLFALGILSLLLIMGLAFVANSLLAQKVANNNSSRSQAKMLALSAISRMAMSVMYYQVTAATNSPKVFPENYMDVCSRFDLSQTVDSSNPADTDGLRGKDSKLIPGISLTNQKYETEEEQKKNLRGEWSYMTATVPIDDSTSVEKIIGRVAYQQIPMTTTAQINLDHNLRGVYEQGTPSRIPWNIRLGSDSNELNFDEATVLKGWQTSYAPESEDSMEASTYDAFFNAYGDSLFQTDTKVKQALVRRWFTDGTVPADPEYYRYDDSTGKITYYHRFNLGEQDEEETSGDEWYARLGNIEKNSEAAVDALAGNSVEFHMTDTLTPEGVGLPFLKEIGSSPGSFQNIENRRRQIAANLNDYCDSDSIPTSNVKAEYWKGNLKKDSNVDTEWPKYTGNEKTPYINEFAFGFQFTPSLEQANTSSMKIVTDVKAALAAELISIYEKAPEDSYTLYMGLPSGDQCSFTLAMNATLEITRTDATGASTTETKEVEKSFPFQLGPDSGASGDPDIRKMEFAASLWQDGYALNHLELPLQVGGNSSGKATWDVCSGIALAPTDQVKLQKVGFKIKEFSFQPRGIALTGQGPDLGGAECGVDFVRWKEKISQENTKLEAEKILFSEESNYNAGSLTVSGTSLSVTEEHQKIFLAGMQARDPRQNLNVVLPSDAEEKSDWRTMKDIQWIESSGNDEGVLSMKVNFASDLSDSFESGLVNKDVSNPDQPVTETEGETALGDKETVTDPAWRTSTTSGTGSDEHLSTAYIRNAPMRSPWELGVIHRAMAWQTINLKSAMRPVVVTGWAAEPAASVEPIRNEDMRQDLPWGGNKGTSFAGGDGGLLEQIKMSDDAYCYGKLNVNILSNNTTLNPDYTDKDDEIGRALFYKIRKGQSVGDLLVEDTGSYPETGTEISWTETAKVEEPMRRAVDEFRAKYQATAEEYADAFGNRAQFLAWENAAGNSLANGFGILSDYPNLPDAQREEIVGKTINLIKGANSVSNMIRFVVVAQTIRDMNGTIARIRYDGDVETKDCKYGEFDLMKDEHSSFPEDFPENDKYLYFDEITGEVKLLVTMENNPTTGQIIVRQIEYIE